MSEPKGFREYSLIEVPRLAEGIWRVLGRVRVAPSTRAALDAILFDSTVRWAVALVLSCWRHTLWQPWAADARRIMAEAGGAELLNFSLPASLVELLTASDARNTQAQVELIAELLQRVLAERSIEPKVVVLLKDDRLLEAGRNLIRRFPEPGSQRPSDWEAVDVPPPQPPSSQAKGPARGKRFDRADYSSRRRKG